MGLAFDEARLAAIATATAEAFEFAATGEESWDLVLRVLNAEFPNAYFALVNQDFLHGRINRAVSSNLDPSLLASYSNYYAFINPYQKYWIGSKSGEILSSEAILPVRSIHNTEFYNDWMSKADGRTESVGLKLDASPTDTIYLPMHTTEDCIEWYEPACAKIFDKLRGPLARAIRTSRTLQSCREGTAARAALIGHNQGPAFVIEHDMRVIDANAEATALLRRNRLIGLQRGRMYFRDKTLTENVAFRVKSLASSALAQASRYGWDDGNSKWLISFTRLPGDATQRLLVSHTQILLRLTDLSTRPPSGSLTEFARLFRLTPAETHLAAALGDGLSVADAAAHLGIAFETARHRLKQIFQKTGTAKQSELCVLLIRFHNS